MYTKIKFVYWFCDINHSIKGLTSEEDFNKDQYRWFDPKACSYKVFVVNVERQMQEAAEHTKQEVMEYWSTKQDG